jgi:hypothetical protein
VLSGRTPSPPQPAASMMFGMYSGLPHIPGAGSRRPSPMRPELTNGPTSELRDARISAARMQAYPLSAAS